MELAGLGQPGRGEGADGGGRTTALSPERPSGRTAALRPPPAGRWGKEWGEPLIFHLLRHFSAPEIGRDPLFWLDG